MGSDVRELGGFLEEVDSNDVVRITPIANGDKQLLGTGAHLWCLSRAQKILPLIVIMVSTIALDREHCDDGSCVRAWLRCCRRVQAHQPPVALCSRPCRFVDGVVQRLGVSFPLQHTRLCKLADGGGQHLRFTTKLYRPGQLTLRGSEGLPQAHQRSWPSLQRHLSAHAARKTP